MSLGYSTDQMRLIVNRATRASDRTRTALEEVLGLHAACTIPDDADTVLEALNQGHPVSRVARGTGSSVRCKGMRSNSSKGRCARGTARRTANR